MSDPDDDAILRDQPESDPGQEQVKVPAELPVLPLRDMVVYPFIIAPLSVAREISSAWRIRSTVCAR